MKRLFAIAAIAVASPAFAEDHCTLAEAKALEVQTEQAFTQVELFLPAQDPKDKAFFDAEYEAFSKRVFSRTMDNERDQYVYHLPNFALWNFHAQIGWARDHIRQFHEYKVPATKPLLIRSASMIPVTVHGLSTTWKDWYFTGQLKGISPEVANKVEKSLDFAISSWGFFVQQCGAELMGESVRK